MLRDFDINSIRVVNPEGPVIWYTDPFGGNAQTESFPGAIEQFISRIDNTHGGANMSGPSVGRDRNHGGPGVHAPS